MRQSQFGRTPGCISVWIILILFGCKKHSTEKEDSMTSNKKLVTIIDSLAHPWSMAFLSEEEVLVAEKDGFLKQVNLTTKASFIIKGFPNDLVDDVREQDPRDNAGIFEVLVDPHFEQSKWIYVSYAAKADGGTTTKVIRARLENDSLQSIQTLLLALPYSPDRFHYGGGMTFGTDQKLYVTIGERYYNEIDQPELPIAQNPEDSRGMIYRINPDGSIPEDNPDFGEYAIPGVYAIGIRAAQGLAVHPTSGVIWFSEHGSRQGDEINILKRGANYGWPIVTTGGYRNEDYSPPTLENRSYTDPVWHWEETVAPTGLCFYSGNEFSEWNGNLIVPGLSRGSLWRLEVIGAQIVKAEKLFEDQPIRLRKVVQSPGGKLYLLTDEDNGRILQVVK